MNIHEWLFEWSSWGWPLFTDHLRQATIFSILVLMVALAFNRKPARIRYAVWMIAFLLFVLPSALLVLPAKQAGWSLELPISISSLSEQSCQWMPEATEAILLSSEPINIRSLSGKTVSQQGHNEIYCIATIIWVTICALILGVWCRRRLKFSSALRTERRIIDRRVIEILARVRNRLSIKHDIDLLISAGVEEPGVWRSWKPVLILPESIADYLSDDELSAVLMHEAVHVSRRDNLMSNLQMVICSLLWFHPLVWLIDRRLLSERECACDEKVLELGIGSKIYASSLLKVLRFCLGQRVAGVSSVAGSNLQRRVKSIMANNAHRKVNKMHKVLVGSIASLVIFLSISANLLSQPNVLAQNSRTPTPTPNRPSQEDWVQTDDQLVTPKPKGRLEIYLLKQEKELLDMAAQSPYTPIRFENEFGAPISIADAEIKIVSSTESIHGSNDGSVKTVVTQPKLRLVNNTNQRIVELMIGLNVEPISRDIVRRQVSIESNSSHVLQLKGGEWFVVVSSGKLDRMLIKIVGVRFEDGSVWGDMMPYMSEVVPPPPMPVLAPLPPSTPLPSDNPLPPISQPLHSPRLAIPPQAAPPPEALPPVVPPGVAPVVAPMQPAIPPKLSLTPAAPGNMAGFNKLNPGRDLEYALARYQNPVGSPIVITEAKTITNFLTSEVVDQAGNITNMPIVWLLNTTNRRITYVKIRFKADAESHAVTAISANLEPYGSFRFFKSGVMKGNAREMTVQIIGVKFEDGSVWGSLDSTIDTRQQWIEVE
jgi:beta-lactamase regulating signal transducer with metallopeptidase domain